MKDKIIKVLREHYSNFETILEKEYENLIVEHLENDVDHRVEWATYNQLILEFKHNIRNNLYVAELQYRLSDNEDPINVCLDVINKYGYISPELERLADKIRDF